MPSSKLRGFNPGKDRLLMKVKDYELGIFTVLGRSFMGPKVDCPFQTADRIIEELNQKTRFLDL